MLQTLDGHYALAFWGDDADRLVCFYRYRSDEGDNMPQTFRSREKNTGEDSGRNCGICGRVLDPQERVEEGGMLRYSLSVAMAPALKNLYA